LQTLENLPVQFLIFNYIILCRANFVSIATLSPCTKPEEDTLGAMISTLIFLQSKKGIGTFFVFVALL
jgi:hypothetical protein